MNKNEQGRVLETLRKNLLYYQEQKRAHGDPHNPYRALPGHEAEFEAASEGAHDMAVVVKIFEKIRWKERLRQVGTFLGDVLETMTLILLALGMVGGSAVVLAVLSVTRHWPPSAVCSVILAAAVAWETFHWLRKSRK